MNVTEPDDNEPIAEPTPELLAALREVGSFEVPAEIDQRVLSVAHETLDSRINKIERPDFEYGRWLAVAAAIALCLAILNSPKDRNQAEAQPVATVMPADLNGDENVDILDAMLFARRIESGETEPHTLDLNKDGITDQRDLDLLTADLVKLDDAI